MQTGSQLFTKITPALESPGGTAELPQGQAANRSHSSFILFGGIQRITKPPYARVLKLSHHLMECSFFYEFHQCLPETELCSLHWIVHVVWDIQPVHKMSATLLRLKYLRWNSNQGMTTLQRIYILRTINIQLVTEVTQGTANVRWEDVHAPALLTFPQSLTLPTSPIPPDLCKYSSCTPG